MGPITSQHYRITVLTSRLLRLEYSPSGRFVDAPTQLVCDRDLGDVRFRVIDEPGRPLEVITEHLHLRYDRGPFTGAGLSVTVLGGLTHYQSVWRFGQAYRDLGGTVRTLDDADGAVELGPGLMSRDGFTVVDDSHSLALTGDGWVTPRPDGGTDLYLFGYGRDYRGCLRDFHRLTGPVPLIPRYALGNWWSRYHPYTGQEYLDLLDRFGEERVPLSVAVLDMDWHPTVIDPEHGSGWTGYSWNRELFADPDDFCRRLRERGLALTLNVHPADGIAAHEDTYPRVAEALGLQDGQGAAFDCTDRDFMSAYFELVHHPLEDAGVDFWWIDWQSGEYSAMAGLDPLWMLNHLHHRDAGREGRRPLILSRYAGLGSHRYPVGFSGDTVISWESLAFQPFFTATAANVGYGWWSHDVGGHLFGYHDEELTVRWLQFGVFSPVNRLHSTRHPFIAKEPWRFEEPYRRIMRDALRLRHRLIPYLYTMNHRASACSVPLVSPMYYSHPEDDRAYLVPGQYWFGSELIVAPILAPLDPVSGLGTAEVFLPPGTWFDVFTGLRYSGDRLLRMHRGLDGMPVLIGAGGILVLGEADAPARENPAALEVRVYLGASGEFTLREDAGGGCLVDERHWARTPIRLTRRPDGGHRLRIGPAEGNLAVLPDQRDWTVVAVGAGGELRHRVSGPVGEPIELDLPAERPETTQDLLGRCFTVLDRARCPHDVKYSVWEALRNAPGRLGVLPQLGALDLPRPVADALTELLCADSSHPGVDG